MRLLSQGRDGASETAYAAASEATLFGI